MGVNKFKSVLKKSSIYLFANILGAGATFILIPILTRKLSPDEYGQVAVFQSLLGLIVSLVGFGVVGSTSRKYFDQDAGPDELKKYIGGCILIITCSSLTLLILGLLFSSYIKTTTSIGSALFFGIILAGLATALIQIRLSQWQVRGEAILYGVMQATQTISILFATILAVLVFDCGAAGRIYSQVGVTVLLGVISCWHLTKNELVSFCLYRFDLIKEALRFGIGILPHSLSGFLMGPADRIVISQFIGVADAGIYLITFQVASVMSILVEAFMKSYVPYLWGKLKAGEPGDKIKAVRFFYLCLLLLCFLVVVVKVFGKNITVLMVDGRYKGIGDNIDLLFLGQSLNAMHFLVSTYIFYSKRTEVLSVISMICGISNMLMMPMLLKQFGSRGAAYSYCIANLVQFLATWYAANRVQPMPWFSRSIVDGLTKGTKE